MKKRLPGILVATQFLGTWLAVAQTHAGAGTNPRPSVIHVNASPATGLNHGRTNPVIAISPRVLDFGSIALGSTDVLSFTVQNVGVGVLTGAADVSAPFSIIGGSPYVLSNSQTQVIMVQFAPKAMAIHMTVVHVTGGGGASITVTGSVAPRLPTVPARPAAPTQPRNLRLLAGH